MTWWPSTVASSRRQTAATETTRRARSTSVSSRSRKACSGIRRSTVEHVFGTLKHWMGPAHFPTRTLRRVSTEMSLQVLAYNLKRMMNILGVVGTLKAMKTAAS
ncbi:transposase [Paraburkholderia caledonica]|uniref:transposase n=1 Tax=Paraburkholderia caledonica TaxID=134536 RepID=UPI0038B9BD4E